MQRLLFLWNARLNLFFKPVRVQVFQKVFQFALFLPAKVLQVIEQPLRPDLRIPAHLLNALLQLLQHDISVTRRPQRISSPGDTAVYTLERPGATARFKRIQRGAQAARCHPHPMHRLHIFMPEYFTWILQKLLQTVAQHSPPGLLERLYALALPVETDGWSACNEKSGQVVPPVAILRGDVAAHVIQPHLAVTLARQQHALANSMRADRNLAEM